jgi:hypothetical protein
MPYSKELRKEQNMISTTWTITHVFFTSILFLPFFFFHYTGYSEWGNCYGYRDIILHYERGAEANKIHETHIEKEGRKMYYDFI